MYTVATATTALAAGNSSPSLRGRAVGGQSYPTANLGPLPTTFTQPSNCASLTLGYSGEINGTSILQFAYGDECNTDDVGRRAIPSCLPGRYGVAYNQLNPLVEGSSNIYPVFSPASICPPSYISACGFTGATPSSSPVLGSDLPLTSGASAALAGKVNASNEFTSVMSHILATDQTAIGCCPR